MTSIQCDNGEYGKFKKMIFGRRKFLASTGAAACAVVMSSEVEVETVSQIAGRYSKTYKGVVCLVYGKADDATNAQIGEAVKGTFSKKNIPSKIFADAPDHRGVSIKFFLKVRPTALSR